MSKIKNIKSSSPEPSKDFNVLKNKSPYQNYKNLLKLNNSKHKEISSR